MKELLESLKKATVEMNGIKVVPFSVIEHLLEKYEETNIEGDLNKIQKYVLHILKTLEKDTKNLLND